MQGRERLYEDDKVMLEHNKVSDHYDLRDSQTGMFMRDGGEIESGVLIGDVDISDYYKGVHKSTPLYDNKEIYVAINQNYKEAIMGDLKDRYGIISSNYGADMPLYFTIRNDQSIGFFADGGIIEGELEEAISKLEAVAKKQQFMKNVNSILRSKDDVENKLRSLGLSEESIIKAQEPDRYGGFGFPSYALTNNNANLKRLEKRVEMLKDKMGGLMDAELGNEEAYEFDGGEIKVNYPIDRVQILFPNGRTDKDTYRLLRKNGWVYSRTNQAFQRKITPQAIRNGVKLFNATKVTPNKEKTMNEDTVYIKYMNKDKGFNEDKKTFKSYDDATKWGRENLEKFNPDMINYISTDYIEEEEEEESIVGNYYYDTRYDKPFQVISVEDDDMNIQYINLKKNQREAIETIKKREFDYFVESGAWNRYENPTSTEAFDDMEGGRVEMVSEEYVNTDYFQAEAKKKAEKEELVYFTDEALKVVPRHQRGIIKGALEEFQDAIIRINKVVEEMPKTYETDGVKDKTVYLHYFYGGADWYIIEKDMSANTDGHLQDFGYANLGHGAELGYISIKELVNMGNVELDFYFEPTLWSEIDGEKESEIIQEDDYENPSDDEYPQYNFKDGKMGVVNSKEFILTKELGELGARLIREGDYPNEISFKYNENSFNLFDNGGEFKLDNKTINEYLGAIYFTELDRIKDPKELAKEVMVLAKHSIEEPKIEESIVVGEKEVVELNPKITRLINFLNENKIPKEKAFRWNDADIEDETMASRNMMLPQSGGKTLWQVAIDFGKFDVGRGGREHNVTWDGGDLLEAIKEFYATKNMGVKLTVEEPILEVETTNNFKGTEITAYENPYELNRAIESLIDEKGDLRENYDANEIEFIGYYSGYGGLEKFGAKGKGLLYEYFTPTEICEKMMALAYKYGYGTIGDNSILEPSVGTGNFLKYAPENVKIDAYEINIYSKQICQILYPHAEVTLRSFEENFIKNNLSVKGKTNDTHKYSLVIGNPPYGVVGGKYMGMGEKKYTNASNYTEYFITRGLDMLVSGGLLMYIVGAEQKNGGTLFLDSGDSKVKRDIFNKADLIDAYRLPTNIFERTGVSSEILVFKKR